jgi:hypothetical protein
MVAKEVFVKNYNFNPNWVQHASMEKVPLLESKKVIVEVSCKIYSEPVEIFSAPQHR